MVFQGEFGAEGAESGGGLRGGVDGDPEGFACSDEFLGGGYSGEMGKWGGLCESGSWEMTDTLSY